MKKTNITRYALILFALVVGVVACKHVDKKKDGGQTVKPLVKKAIESKVKDIVYPLPTTFELASMLNRIGADYIIGLSNPSENAAKYFT